MRVPKLDIRPPYQGEEIYSWIESFQADINNWVAETNKALEQNSKIQ